MGLNLDQGERPQLTIGGGSIFGAELSVDGDFCLVSCMVSPGFDYRDFELFTSEELCGRYPDHQAVIRRLNG